MKYQRIHHLSFLLFLLTLILESCNTQTQPDPAKLKQEVVAVEKAFNDHAANQGLKSAFVTFADDSAVINRRNQIVKGKEEIGAYFDGFDYESVTLTWKPDFVEVSKAGDMAYTYGTFEFISTDSAGVEQQSRGVFHTVWKRQTDGSWKYVYD